MSKYLIKPRNERARRRYRERGESGDSGRIYRMDKWGIEWIKSLGDC